MTVIAEATGYAGTSAGPMGPLIELAMNQAVANCMAMGITDDSPPEVVEAITGVVGIGGSEYIRQAKLAARQQVKDDNRAITIAHETAQATALDNARDDQ